MTGAPGNTLYFKGGEYALHTGPVENYYYAGGAMGDT